MVKNEKKPGPVDETPGDMRRAVSSEATTQAAWRDPTPLARNEWICWVISAKRGTTRSRRIQRVVEELKAGKRRPSCWPGCPRSAGGKGEEEDEDEVACQLGQAF